mgnify:CR=1 FL=1
MPKKFLTSVVKKQIDDRSYLCVKLGKTIKSSELKKLRTYIKASLEEFTFEDRVEQQEA